MAAIRYASVCFLYLAVYYLVLGGLRAYLIVCYRRRTPELERRCYHTTAWLLHFGMEKVMLCDHSDFRLKLAEELGFAVCNPAAEDFAARAAAYFGTAPSLSGSTADIDCWLDAAGAESILNVFLRLGKIESRFVSVAVNNKPRTIDLLHMTYAQQSMIGSGGYMPEDVRDVQEIMSCGKWDLERIITHEFPLVE